MVERGVVEDEVEVEGLKLTLDGMKLTLLVLLHDGILLPQVLLPDSLLWAKACMSFTNLPR